MAKSRLYPVVRQLRKLVSAANLADLCDRELLERFAREHDEAAFTALVDRHAALIMGVCRRVLGPDPEAEDAFQAAFLVLASKAGSIGWHDSVSTWLYKVAYRICLRARARRARRQRTLRPLDQPTAARPAPVTLEELNQTLDQAIQSLPEKYRAPLVLCCLEGKTYDEAAAVLGWTPDSVRGRLNRAREMLRRRLSARGLLLPATLLAALMTQTLQAAPLSKLLLAGTVRAAAQFAAGHTAGIPAAVLTLSQGVIQTMFWTKMLTGFAILIAIAGLGLGGKLLVATTQAEQAASSAAATATNPPAPAAPEKLGEIAGVRGTIQSVNAAAITLNLDGNQKVPVSFDLARTVQVLMASRPAPIGSLKEGQEVTLQLAADNRTVAAIHAEGERIEGKLSKLDAASRTVTLILDDDDENGQTRSFTIPAGTPVYIDDYLGQLADLADCGEITIELAADQSVGRIQAQWQEDGDPAGRIQAVNALGGTLTLEYEENDQDVTRTLKIPDTAKLFLNGKPAKLADLKPGYHAVLRVQALDKVTGLRAVIRQDDNDDNDND